MPAQNFFVAFYEEGKEIIDFVYFVDEFDEQIVSQVSAEDLEILLFVSQHIVNCFDRVKSRELTEKTIRQRTKQLRQINDELQEEISERQKIESLQQALVEISELSGSVEGNMDDFYAAIHDTLTRLIGAQNCYIAIIDNQNQALQFPYYKDDVHSEVEPRPMGLGLRA